MGRLRAFFPFLPFFFFFFFLSDELLLLLLLLDEDELDGLGARFFFFALSIGFLAVLPPAASPCARKRQGRSIA